MHSRTPTTRTHCYGVDFRHYLGMIKHAVDPNRRPKQKQKEKQREKEER